MRRGDAIVAGLLVVAAAAFSLAAPEGHSLAGASPTFQGANLDEVADPGVPAANVVRLWAEDVESLAIANSSGTAYFQVTADGTVDLGTTAGATDGSLSLGTIVSGGNYRVTGSVDLTDASATTVCTVPLANGATAGGTVQFSVIARDSEADDGRQVAAGLVYWGGVNVADSLTLNSVEQGKTTALSAGTLTTTWAESAGSDQFTITLNANTSFASPTTFKVFVTINSNVSGVTVP